MALAVFCYAVLSLLLYKCVLYPAFFSPLSKIPNAHFTSPFSNIWIQVQRYRSTQNRVIHDAHKRLGPVIRLGATELSVNSLEDIRTVYGDGFDRHDWYSRAFENYGVQNMFSMTQRRPHKERKRILASLYSKSTLYASPEIRKISQVLLQERLLPTIESSIRRKNSLDVLELSLATSIDFITAYLFGLHNSTDFVQDIDTRKQWLYAHDRTKGKYFWSLEFPGLSWIMKKLGFNIVHPEIAPLTKEVKGLCLELMDRAEISSSSAERSSTDDSIKWTKPVVYERLQQHLQPPYSLERSDHSLVPNTIPQLRSTVASELMDQIMAGTETTGWTLTYVMYELSLRPQLQSSLRSELLSLAPSMVYTDPLTSGQATHSVLDLPPPRAIDALPLLHAVTLETLRRYPAVPGSQPRTSRTPTTLGCYPNIPPGIRIGAQAYSLHRNEDIFPDPESWMPMRWLDCDKELKEKMIRWFWGFGSGGRMCIGNHFAMLELKLIIGAIYTNHATKIVEAPDIEQVDEYTGGPKGNKVILEFQRA